LSFHLYRHIYSNSHYDYVAETGERIVAKKKSLIGYKIIRQASLLRHFMCDLEPVKPERVKVEK